MLLRYVIVPALPDTPNALHRNERLCSDAIQNAYDIYDNQEKQRLKPSYPTQKEAAAECEKMNQGVIFDPLQSYALLKT